MASASEQSLSDLLRRLGDVPLGRIRLQPAPGTATVRDVIDLQEREGRLYELIDGVLLEKVMGYSESGLAMFLGSLLIAYVHPRNLGLVTGPDGTMQLMANLVRIPDVAFTSWERLPGRRRPAKPVPLLAPNLAVEILSRSNTAAEMEAKRHDYFAAGVELVWEIDPEQRTAAVYTSPTQVTTLGLDDSLDGGSVLPGFRLVLKDLFAELDRQG
jgi:Uma2 family endonuclease